MSSPLLAAIDIILGIAVIALGIYASKLKILIQIIESDLSFERRRNSVNENYLISIIADKEQDKLLVDSRTYSLITLAVRINNDNEARNAAVQACKKIIKLVTKI